jgi:predicted transcriptional regulator
MSRIAEPEASDPSGQAPGYRRALTDPKALRALTHPVRLALLEALDLEGPLTATQAGEVIGEAPNTCSFHFRQLAKYGLIEEAGQAPGHARPWRLKTWEVRLPDLYDTSDTAAAARALKGLARERYFARAAAFEESRASYPAAWQEAAGFNETMIHLTPGELKAVRAELVTILDRYRDRNTDPSKRPPGSLPVEVLTFGYPLRPPE